MFQMQFHVTAFHEFSVMLTATSLKPLTLLSSLDELWLVLVSRLPLFLPEGLTSSAGGASDLRAPALELGIFYCSTARMVFRNQLTFLFSGMSELSPS